VNSFTRGFASGILALAVLCITGCSADNETEVDKLSKGMGDPGPGAKVDAPTNEIPRSSTYPKSEKDFKAQQGNVDMNSKNYPLAGKKQ